jgi:CRP-like cAMP-binding protein
MRITTGVLAHEALSQQQAHEVDHPARNRILRQLSAAERARIWPKLTLVVWKRGQIVYDTCAVQRWAYFPIDSIVSIMLFLEDGHSCETALVGNDGLVGLPIVTQTESTLAHAAVQVAGSAFRLPASVLREEVERNEGIRNLVLRYAQVRLTQIGQLVTCNRYHTIFQQLARWLLFAADHNCSDYLELTHEQIANSLGVRREGVTEAAGRLQKAGLIANLRGRIRVVDHDGLQTVCCECYRTIKQETERLLPD